MMEPHTHMGIAEIAARIGVSRQRVHQLRAAYADFPPAADELNRGPIWHTGDIEAWIAEHPTRPSGVRHDTKQAPS